MAVNVCKRVATHRTVTPTSRVRLSISNAGVAPYPEMVDRRHHDPLGRLGRGKRGFVGRDAWQVPHESEHVQISMAAIMHPCVHSEPMVDKSARRDPLMRLPTRFALTALLLLDMQSWVRAEESRAFDRSAWVAKPSRFRETRRHAARGYRHSSSAVVRDTLPPGAWGALDAQPIIPARPLPTPPPLPALTPAFSPHTSGQSMQRLWWFGSVAGVVIAAGLSTVVVAIVFRPSRVPDGVPIFRPFAEVSR